MFKVSLVQTHSQGVDSASVFTAGRRLIHHGPLSGNRAAEDDIDRKLSRGRAHNCTIGGNPRELLKEKPMRGVTCELYAMIGGRGPKPRLVALV